VTGSTCAAVTLIIFYSSRHCVVHHSFLSSTSIFQLGICTRLTKRYCHAFANALTLAANKLIRSKTIFIWTLLISVSLSALGQLLFVEMFKLFEPQVDGILFQITERKATVRTSVQFSLLLFLIPIFIIMTWRLAHIISLNKKIASALFILIFITIGIFARHQEVKIYFTTVVRPALLTNGKTSIIYPIDPINFVYYMLAGLMTGCILAVICFGQRKKRKT
jgi:hypothetical protein